MLELPPKQCVQDVSMTQSDSAASAEPRELVRLSTDALREFRDRERARYEAIKARATPFNLARGKPATEQVALANQLLTAVATPEQCWTEDGNDCRNYYGSPQGLIEVRRLFAPMLGAARTGTGRQQFESGADARRAGLCPADRGERWRRVMARSAPPDQVSVSLARLRPPFPDLRAIRDRDDRGAADRGRP